MESGLMPPTQSSVIVERTGHANRIAPDQIRAFSIQEDLGQPTTPERSSYSDVIMVVWTASTMA